MDLTAHWVGITAVVLFILLYFLVIAEEFTRLNKSARRKHSTSRTGEEITEASSGYWRIIFLFLGVVMSSGLAYLIWGTDS
jgi:hypothetical protein